MRKAAFTVMIILFFLPAVSLPSVTETYTYVDDMASHSVNAECIPPPEGIVSWWTGDGNPYDYVGSNHGTMDGDTAFAPGMVGDAFAFDGNEDAIWMPGTGINDLQELSIECWVKHNTPLQSEIDRYVTVSGEKAVLRHDNYNLHFYMTFVSDEFFTATNDLVIPDSGYDPFAPGTIDSEQFSFVTIEGLEAGGGVYITAEFTNGDSDFMCWPANLDPSERSYENNIGGSAMASGRVPEEGMVWLPTDCDTLVIGCFAYDLQPGTWTLHISSVTMEHIFVPYGWDPEVFHHVAGTYDGATMRLYMDGEQAGELFVNLPVVPSGGVEINSWGECLNGLIDEVSIYNRALTDEEILSIYGAGSDGKLKPEDDYYQYSRFFLETETVAGVGGYVEDYGDPDVWGDEIQYLYCVGDMTGYKSRVWLTDYEEEHPGEDTLSPGWIEPHQHPDNPDAPGPIEPRNFETVSHVYLQYGDTDYTGGAGWHSQEFHVDERGVFLGAWPNGIFRFDHNWNDWEGNGVMDYPAEQIAHAPEVTPDPNNIGRTETLAYNPDENVWYAGGRCLGWEYRDIYQLVDTDNDGDFLDEQWGIAFSYPTLNPTNPSEHHDGLEYAGGYLWISDMYSDRIAQWECVDGVWMENNILEYTAAAFVEGMGFGPNDHFWAASGIDQYGQEPHLYEFCGGELQRELATPVYVDIKPGSWPNPINVKENGLLPVAICGTGDFDVSAIDPETIALDTHGCSEIVSPLRWSFEDVATPFLGEPGDGHALDSDGYVDLVLHFDTREVVETLNLAVNAGKTVRLIITAELYSPLGAHVRGQDYVLILDQKGVIAPPEYLRFFEGGLGELIDGHADLSSELMFPLQHTSGPYYPELFGPEEFQLESTLRNGYGFLNINCDKYPLNIIAFRQALAYAMDKHVTAYDVWEGYAQPHDSFLSIVNPFCAEESLSYNYYDADIALGNQLLDEAGFVDTDNDGIREAPDGSKFEIIVDCAEGSTIASSIGLIVAETLQELGVDAIDYPHNFNEYLSRLQNHEDYDIAFLGFNFGFDVRPIVDEYQSDNANAWGRNYPNFRNEMYDFWVEQLYNAEEYDDVAEAAFQLQEIIAHECPVIVCYENLQYGAARRPLENFQVSPMQGTTNYETFEDLEGIYPDFETVSSAIHWSGTLNPFRTSWWYGLENLAHNQFNPMTLVYQSLARMDIGGNLIPQLANSWTVGYDPEGQFIDIDLTKDVMWHDGRAFSVDDIVFTFTYIQDHAFGPFADSCSHVMWIEIVNDRRVKIHLDYASYWSIEAILRVPILPEHIWMHIADPYNDWDELAIGTGPFVLSDYVTLSLFGDTNLDLADNQLVTSSRPEIGAIWTPDEGEYMIGVDYYSGDLPLEYSITISYPNHEEIIFGEMTWDDVLGTGYVPATAEEIEHLHYVWLPANIEVDIVVDWNTAADLDIYMWSPNTIYTERVTEILLQRWPPTSHMEIAYSIAHYYPASAPYCFEDYHVLKKGTRLTIGWGMSAYGSSVEVTEQNLRNRIDAGTIVLTINGEAVSDPSSGYLWEYMSIEYDEISDQYRAYIPYRYYLKPQQAGEYEIYWKLIDPILGTLETTGYVVWVRN